MSKLHQGIDLSRFKKIASDGKTTTLRHAQGHEIKVAHGGLTDAMREQINAMPQHLASEGDVAPAIPAPQNAGGQNYSLNLAQNDAPPQQAPEQNIEQQDATESSQGAPPIVDPDAAHQTGMPTIVPGLGITAEERLPEHMKLAQDMAAGIIKPETYESLYHDQKMPGRIGTLFGLLLSGAGSGLAHQSNMVMDMMNNEINKDLEAQKQNVENGRNYLSMNYAHDLSKAQANLHKMQTLNAGVEGAKEAAKTGVLLKDQTDNPFLKNYIDVMKNIIAPSNARVQMRLGLFDKYDKATDNNPQGKAALQNLKPQIDAANANDIATSSAQAQHYLSTAGAPNTSNRGRQINIDENQFNAAKQNGMLLGPGIVAKNGIDADDIPKVEAERGFLNSNRDKAYSYNDSFNHIYNMPHAGQTPGLGIAGAITGGAVSALTGLGTVLGAGAAGVGGAVGNALEKAFNHERESAKQNAAKYLGVSTDDADAYFPTFGDSISGNEKAIKAAHEAGIQAFRDRESESAPLLTGKYKERFPTMIADFPSLGYGHPKQKKEKATSKKPGASGDW